MSLQTRLSDLIVAIGNEFKADRARLDNLENPPEGEELPGLPGVESGGDGTITDRQEVSSTATSTTSNATAWTSKISETVSLKGGRYTVTISTGFTAQLKTTVVVGRVLLNGALLHPTDFFFSDRPGDDYAGSLGANGPFIKTATTSYTLIDLPEGDATLEFQFASGQNAKDVSVFNSYILIERTGPTPAP